MEKEIIIYKVNNYYDLKSTSWSGALQTLERVEELGKEEEFLNLINAMLEDFNGLEETQLNDFIWFDTEYIEEQLDCKLWDEE